MVTVGAKVTMLRLVGLDLVSWFVEDQVSEYDECWKWECFGKAVSLLIFGVDAGEFHVVRYDVFVEES